MQKKHTGIPGFPRTYLFEVDEFKRASNKLSVSIGQYEEELDRASYWHLLFNKAAQGRRMVVAVTVFRSRWYYFHDKAPNYRVVDYLWWLTPERESGWQAWVDLCQLMLAFECAQYDDPYHWGTLENHLLKTQTLVAGNDWTLPNSIDFSRAVAELYDRFSRIVDRREPYPGYRSSERCSALDYMKATMQWQNTDKLISPLSGNTLLIKQTIQQ